MVTRIALICPKCGAHMGCTIDALRSKRRHDRRRVAPDLESPDYDPPMVFNLVADYVSARTETTVPELGKCVYQLSHWNNRDAAKARALAECLRALHWRPVRARRDGKQCRIWKP